MDSPIGENPICSRVDSTAFFNHATFHTGINDARYRKKSHIQFPAGKRCRTQMHKNRHTSRPRRVVKTSTTVEDQMNHYCASHPGSPSAVRRPQLFFRGDLWIALLGQSLKEGIVGIGPTVSAALRAFDGQYLARLRPPNEGFKFKSKPGRAVRATVSLLVVLFLSILSG